MATTSSKLPKPHYSIFDVAGPIMVGPSSSHTAGACKIGQIARALYSSVPEKVTFYLHGSFATVYKGHSTDRALLAGVLKCKTADPRIKTAFDLAKEKKLKYEFKTVELGPEFHPNSVRIVFENKGKKPMIVIGSSIGGGMVKIVQIDEFRVNLTGISGQYKTLIVWHENSKKIDEDLSEKIKKYGLRIHDIQTARVDKKSLSVFNLDGRDLTLKEVLQLEKIPGVEDVRSLTKLET